MEKGENERIGNNVHDDIHYLPLFDRLGCEVNLVVSHGSANFTIITPLGTPNKM